MEIQERLKHVADAYRAQGYKVVVAPGPDDLPDFAKGFKIEIVARRDDGGVLASAKKSQSDLESDRNISRYAEITGKERGWRFDVVVLGSESEDVADKPDAKEPSDEEVGRAFADVDRMLQAGFVREALVAAWGVLEIAMRRRLQAEGEDAGWGLSPRTMLNELYSVGVLQGGEFRDLEGLFQARSAIVHGFITPAIEKNAVEFLIATAQTLLEESRLAKKTS